MTNQQRLRRHARPGADRSTDARAPTSPATPASLAPLGKPRSSNRGMQRLMTGAGAGIGAVSAGSHPNVQAQLTVGAVNDPLERDADRVADQVTQGGLQDAKGIGTGSNIGSNSLHSDKRGGNAQAPPVIRRRSGSNAAAQRAAPPSVGRALAEGGRPLPPALQSEMGQRIGHDFAGVRLHTGGAAARSARDIQAHAYTAGRHIVFGEGQFQPNTPRGRHLLAHELTHTVQQGQALQTGVVQRDFSLAPTAPAPAEVVLTEAQMRTALRFDRVVFTDAAEVEIVRDVLGLARVPSVIDEDLVNAIARYQAQFGMTADGMLGAGTAAQLEREITAESDALGDAASGTPMQRVARRLHLRSLTTRRTGRLSHQGFVGDDANPEGAVTARLADNRDGAQSMSLEYSGENANRVDWLQFVNMRMFATPTGAAAPVFRAGTVQTSSGPTAFSDNTTTNWSVDGDQAGVAPLYNDTFDAERRPSRALAMFDRPGGATVVATALAFVAGPAAGATRVTFLAGFESYVVRNNHVLYRVAWSASTVVDVAAATASGIMYSQGAAGQVTSLRAVHRTALLAEYPGNPIR